MHPLPRAAAALILLLAPLSLAASDPTGDVVSCPGAAAGAKGDAPDLVSARGQIVELGTSALWTLRFAEPLQVPDTRGKPFRVDLVLHDPAAPTVSFAYYHGLNRLVRYDAVLDPTLTILLLPERGQNVFSPPQVEGDTMTIQVPGRILSADEDLTGTSPGIERVRWSVIVRDEGSCDFLGSGRPSERMIPVETEVGPSPAPAQAEGSSGSGGIPRGAMWLGAALLLATGFMVRMVFLHKAGG